ncbi:hypothetical protein CRG98_017475, partial [Punica granatum]
MGEVEVCTDAPSETPCLRSELKRDRQCIEDDTETYPVLVKKHAVEASHEDIRSEVSNPIASPKETTSTFQDITSQPVQVAGAHQGGCSDETSKISGDSGSEQTLSNEENGGNCAELTGKGSPPTVKVSGNSGSHDTFNHEENGGSYAESSDKGLPGSVKVSASSDSEATLSNDDNGGNYVEGGKSSPGSVKVSAHSGSEETLSSEENAGNYGESSGKASLGSVTKSCVVLEIPQHASTTGVRKITFRFSKRKDLDSQPAITGAGSNVPYRNSEEEQEQDFLTSVGTSPGAYMSTHGIGHPLIGNFHPCAPNMELKMSKKVVPQGFPTNVKKLLSTGILDGARVKYVPLGPERGLEGIISGGGYLCGCSSCNFSRVVSAYEFEQHAGFKTRHPNNHIYLENGKPIYNIIQEVKTAPLCLLDEVIRDIAGSAINEDFFQIWKGNLQQSNTKNDAGKKNGCALPKLYHSRPSQKSEESDIPTSYYPVETTPVKFVEMLAKQKRAVKKPVSCIYAKQLKKSAEGGRK